MAKEKWRNAAKGIRYREHPTRKHGKRPDRYYCLIYKRAGKTIQEAVGWASDGVTQDECEKKLVALRENWRSGEGPQTLTEMRLESQRQREAELAAQEAELIRRTTLADYFEQNFKPYALRTKKKVSAEKEFGLYNNWIGPLLGSRPLVGIDFPEWDELLKVLDKGSLSPRTKEYIAGTLRRILRHAQDRGMDVKIPSARQIGATGSKDNRRLRVLTPEESEKILADLEKRDIYAWRVVKFAMLTGCRASEAFGLRWRDVDFEEKQLRFVDTKNKDARTIFFSPALETHLKSFGPGKPDAVVFPRSDGKPHVEAPFSFKAAVKDLKLNDDRGPRERVSFHTIRHTVATQLAKVLDVRSLMDIMGWRQISMAARYIHSNEETKRAAMNVLEQSLKKQQAKVIPFAGKNAG